MIDAVRPCVDGGRFPVKRVVGEPVHVVADLVCDGHDGIAGDVVYRRRGEAGWRRAPLSARANDEWAGVFTVDQPGWWEFAVESWVDRYGSWARDMAKRLGAGQDVRVEAQIGASMLEGAIGRVGDELERRELEVARSGLLGTGSDIREGSERAIGDRVVSLMREHAERRFIATTDEPIRVWVDRKKALFSSWYEMFPRSASAAAGHHGTLSDVRQRLDYVEEMGFDVLYLPPIHPIGVIHRKGPNNAPSAGPGDPGSCWAIGGDGGGHTAILRELGTLADFDALVEDAAGRGIEIALDIAFQCSPDHPWVTEHPSWFRHRPDGTIQYAENPPKKYQDIYPIDFESDDWESLWVALRGVFEFWIEHSVKIFRVDNPHTKNFRFWDWCIGSLLESHPDVLFLSEAFTRPKRMYRLAKGGFTQSYTYFAWRNGPHDLEQYMYELTRTDAAEFFRPNFWPNTPDILTEYLQHGGRPAALARVVLAGTLSSSYGIYGPAFELQDFTPREPGSEETLNSEKYQLRHWDLDNDWSLAPFIGLLNRIRRDNPALQQTRRINFHRVDNPALVAYSKRDSGGENCVLCVVNTNPFEEQWGGLHLDFGALGVDPARSFAVHDLLTDTRYIWHGGVNRVGLGPSGAMAHVFRVEQAEAGVDWEDA